MAAHQAPLSLGFSRQEHWSGLPFPSPMNESEKWKWSRSVVSDSSDPMDCSLPGSSTHGIFQARVLEGVAIAFSTCIYDVCLISVQLLSEILFWKKSFVLLTSKQFPRIAFRNPKVRFVPIPYTFLFFLQFMSPEIMPFVVIIWLPRWHSGKEFACQCRRGGFDPWVGKISWRSAWQPTPVFLPAEFHGQRSLAGYSPWGHKELDRTEHARSLYYCHYCLFLILSDRKLKNHIIQYLTLDKPFWSPLWWEGLRDRS